VGVPRTGRFRVLSRAVEEGISASYPPARVSISYFGYVATSAAAVGRVEFTSGAFVATQ